MTRQLLSLQTTLRLIYIPGKLKERHDLVAVKPLTPQNKMHYNLHGSRVTMNVLKQIKAT